MLDEKMDKMIQKKKIRVSSWIFALVYLIYGYLLFEAAATFGKIYREMEVTLPSLTNLVVSVPIFVWPTISFILAVLSIIRDTTGKTAILPNWAALIILFVSALVVTIALFLPAYSPIYTLGNI